MVLPVRPPVRPMLARLSRDLPVADGLLYEPKWDGFRGLVFRDGQDVELRSRNDRSLTRYFPELLEPLLGRLPERVVLDGEIVIAGEHGLDFDALLQRIHPASSRVSLLAAETPASFVAFDVLALGDDDLRPLAFSERRARLEQLLAATSPPVLLTPATSSAEVAADWFSRFEGAGLDGVVAKPLALPYLEDERAMTKVKHERTADCVVAGFRWHKTGPIVGSLLLGLFDDEGVLHHVGVTATFKMTERRSLVETLAPYRTDSFEGHPWGHWAEIEPGPGRQPGGPSRWNAKKDLSWEPLRPELVVEVAFDHLQGDRFRHAARFERWRPDREPSSCTYAQLDAPVPEELAAVFGA